VNTTFNLSQKPDPLQPTYDRPLLQTVKLRPSLSDITMNLLILNHYATCPRTPGGTRHYQLARGLVDAGWDVSIIAASVNHLSGEQRLSDDESIRIEMVNGVRFVWIRTPPYRGNGMKRIWGMIVYSLKSCGENTMARLPRPDVVIGSSVHPGAGVAAATIARRYGIPFVFEVRDLWPETLIAFGALRERSIIARVLGLLELRLFREAVRIITVLPGVAAYVERVGLDASKVVWIPNGVAMTEPTADSASRACELRLHYVGSLGAANAMDCVIDAMGVVERTHASRSIQLHLYGDGPCRKSLTERARVRGLTSVYFHGPIPKSHVLQALQAADALVISAQDLPRLYRYGIGMNKLFDYLESGRPVLAAMDVPDNPVSASGGGIVVPPGHSERLAEAILAMADLDPVARQAMGDQGRQWVRRHHDYCQLSAKLDCVLRDVCSGVRAV
jgi:glycosyltransferase involved in cell wall biosynthesis